MDSINISIKKIMIILLMMMIVVVSGTFAWFTYQSNKSSLVLSIGNINDSKVIIKPYQIRETLIPSSSYDEDVYSQISVLNNNSSKMLLNLYYKINQLDEIVINNGLRYTIASSSSIDGEYVEVTTGDFTLIENNQLTILDVEIEANTTLYYRIYPWIDTDVGNQVGIQSSVVDIELNGMVKNNSLYQESILNGADPVLEPGMIPITLSNDGVAMTADISQEWYNYSNKEWANAILVNENATTGVENSHSREYYLNNPGTQVAEDDILAYFVWIPRYKYKVWLMDGTTSSSPQTIDIIFENNETTKSVATKVGEYYTHPAFTFGDDELNGIWVGKFETTGDTTIPTVLPKDAFPTYISLSTLFSVSLKFAGDLFDNNTGVVVFSNDGIYGLTENTDSHMMKNSEWGAVAYLSHSEYGINKEVAGSKWGVTGSYGWYGNEDFKLYGIPIDGDSSYPQSTTGNISGVFDMAGGVNEIVMGIYEYPTTDYSGFDVLPESKYYDSYNITSSSSCTLATCGGHALNETDGWYSGFMRGFIYNSMPWFSRGGDSHTSSIFDYSNDAAGVDQNEDYEFTFRTVIVDGSE